MHKTKRIVLVISSKVAYTVMKHTCANRTNKFYPNEVFLKETKPNKLSSRTTQKRNAKSILLPSIYAYADHFLVAKFN